MQKKLELNEVQHVDTAHVYYYMHIHAHTCTHTSTAGAPKQTFLCPRGALKITTGSMKSKCSVVLVCMCFFCVSVLLIRNSSAFLWL